MKLKTLIFFIVMLLGSIIILSAPHLVQAATRTWDGGGSTNSWNECANWDGPDLCPTSGDAVVFSSTSTKDSSVTVGSNFLGTIASLSINSGYTGTITQTSDLTVTGNFSHLAVATYNAAGKALSVGGTFLLNNASANFKASSGTTSFAGSFTLTAGTFDTSTNAGGTVNFNGSGSGTLSCNSATFNLVTFTHTGNTKTVSANCSLPLGNNPAIGSGSASLSLTGTITGTGTLTNSSGTITLNTGATIGAGITGLNIFSFRMNGATFNANNYSPFVINGSFTLTTGTFTALTGSMHIGGSFTYTAGTFNNSSGTVVFDQAGGTLSCNNLTTLFNKVVINLDSSFATPIMTINSDCTIPLGANPSVQGQIDLSGTLTGTGTLSGSGVYGVSGGAAVDDNAILFETGYSITGFSQIKNLSFSILTSTDFSSYTLLDLNSIIFPNNKTFTAPPLMIVRQAITSTAEAGGARPPSNTFVAGNGTVRFLPEPSGYPLNRNNVGFNTGYTGITIPNLTFNNLDIEDPTNETMYMPAKITINGTFTAKSTIGTQLKLRNLDGINPWVITANGPRVLSNLDVQNSNNTALNPMIASNSTDSGGNTNWTFSNYSINFFLDYPGGGSHITNTRPTFRWKKATTTTGAGISKYFLSVDNGNTGDFTIDNIVPFVSDVGNNNKTLEYNRYELKDDGDYLNLTTKSSNLWPSSMNNGLLNLGQRTWTITAYDSAGNTRDESATFFVDPITTTTVSSSVPAVFYPIATSSPFPTPESVNLNNSNSNTQNPTGSLLPLPTPTPNTGQNLSLFQRIINFLKSLWEKILNFFKRLFGH